MPVCQHRHLGRLAAAVGRVSSGCRHVRRMAAFTYTCAHVMMAVHSTKYCTQKLSRDFPAALLLLHGRAPTTPERNFFRRPSWASLPYTHHHQEKFARRLESSAFVCPGFPVRPATLPLVAQPQRIAHRNEGHPLYSRAHHAVATTMPPSMCKHCDKRPHYVRTQSD